MPQVRFSKGFSDISVSDGANLMDVLLKSGRPVGSSCGGEGVCTKCLIRIDSGEDQLSAENEKEKELKEKNQVENHYRVSCQTRIFGDIRVDADYW